MLIPENYRLSNEIAKNGNIHIANMSMLIKDIEARNISDTMIKYGACTFINIKSSMLPKYIYKAIHAGELTDLSNCILSTTLKKELQCTIKEVLSIPGTKEIKVQGKSFIQFPKEFIEQLRGKVTTNINKEDFESEKIDGVQLSKNNFWVWY